MVIPLVIAGAAILLLSRTAVAGQDLRVDFNRLHSIGFEGITPYVDISLQFVNSRNVALNVGNVFLTVTNSSQVQLGTVDMPNLNLTIQPNAITERVFRVRLSLLNTALSVLDKNKLKTLLTGIRLNGSLLVNNIRVPITNLQLRA
jgi:hypothetical protein